MKKESKTNNEKKRMPNTNIVCEVNREIEDNDLNETLAEIDLERNVVRINPDPNSLESRG